MPKRLSLEEVTRRAAWTRNCAACDRAFGWSKGGDRAIYCSRACAGAGVGATSRGTDQRADCTCQQCGVLFKTYHKDRKFCSRACSDKGRLGRRMPRGAGSRPDRNQPEIVAALEKAGATVFDASRVGGGCPDLIVGFRGAVFLLEIKNPANGYGRRGLNANQKAWNASWNGPPMVVVYTPTEALRTIGAE